MKVDINRLAEHFARTLFQVEGVYRCVREPGTAGWQKTEPFPGFIFPLGGKAQFRFDGTLYMAEAGSVIHGGANMDLDKKVVSGLKWEHLLVLYKVYGNEPEGFSLQASHFALQTGESPRLAELLERLWQVSKQPGGIYALRTETLFRCVLDEMFISARSQINGGAQKLFKHVTAYMHEHYMDALTVGSLAKQYNVNENRLSYVFHKYAGMGPGDYLIAYRLNRAKELILNMNSPVHAVAKSVGYTDPYHFSRIFKKQFGLSPSEFRKKFKNNTW